MKLHKIYKITTTNKVQEWEVEIEGDKYRTITGQQDGKKIVSEWTICTAKSVGKKNETTPEEQALLEAEALRRKKLEKDYVESLEKSTIYLSPMLAKTYEGETLQYPVYVQPKLDGVRCLHFPEKLSSRNGKEFYSCDHIFYNNINKFNPSIISIDGELYNHDYKDDFNTIVSVVKKQKFNKEELDFAIQTIKYYVYDLIIPDMKFSERNMLLNIIFSSYNPPNWVLVPTYQVNSKEELDKYYEEFLNDGYEGMMIRLDGSYEHKRSKNLLKRKEFQDEEFEILDIIEGNGNRSGMAGYITTQTKDGNSFKSNISGDRNYLKELLVNKEKYIGKSATIKFFRYTPDGIPRFPCVINISRNEYE